MQHGRRENLHSVPSKQTPKSKAATPAACWGVPPSTTTVATRELFTTRRKAAYLSAQTSQMLPGNNQSYLRLSDKKVGGALTSAKQPRQQGGLGCSAGVLASPLSLLVSARGASRREVRSRRSPIFCVPFDVESPPRSGQEATALPATTMSGVLTAPGDMEEIGWRTLIAAIIFDGPCREGVLSGATTGLQG